MSFISALPAILREEGGYVNDLDDSGGATNKGITQAVYDSYRQDTGQKKKSVRYILQSEVSDIYQNRYWHAARCDFMPISVALVHFDFAVNAGVTQAAKTLQGVLGVKRDGKIGPLTLSAIQSYDNKKLVTDYSEARRKFYKGIVKRKPTQQKFLAGWLNRVTRIAMAAIATID